MIFRSNNQRALKLARLQSQIEREAFGKTIGAAAILAMLALFWLVIADENVELIIILTSLTLLLLCLKPRFYSAGILLAVALLSVNIQGPDPSSIMFLLLVIIGHLLGYLRIKDFLLPSGLSVATLIFVIFYTVSAFVNSGDTRLILILIGNLALFIILKLFIRSQNRMRVIFFGLVLGVVVSSSLALAANARWWTPNYIFFETIRSERWQSLMGDSNIYALLSSLLTFWMIDETLKPKLWKGNTLVKILIILLLIPQVGATLSRSGWLCFAAGICLYCLLVLLTGHFKKGVQLVLLGSALLVASAGMISVIGYRTQLIGRASSYMQAPAEEAERLHLTYTVQAIGLAARNPLGVGVGRTADNIVSAIGVPVGAHNAFIQILSDNGWLPFLAFLFFTGVIIIQVFIRAVRGEIQYGVSYQFVFSGLAGLFIIAIFHDLIYWPIAWLLPSIACAMLWHPKDTKARQIMLQA